MNDYEFIISVRQERVGTHEEAVQDAISQLEDHISDADVWEINPYDADMNDGIPTGVGLHFSTNQDVDRNSMMAQFEGLESMEYIPVDY